MSNNYLSATGGMPRMRPRGANAPASLLAAILVGLGAIAIVKGVTEYGQAFCWLGSALILAGILTQMSLKMANQWERAVVLRLGKLQAVRGPGMFLIIPFIDDV
ncbi:MAG TPA: hypothetical protein VFW13_15405, partial [Phenylobacterium sp.]|nr:hypothetical protein [Phenylobacterium sp.]